ncbi:MAG TPA: ATP/GTP-binding protein [Coleofasciculaceae cyanobacterium]
MDSLRFVVTGTVGAGKSTFVRTFSETAVVDTERSATDQTSLLKKKTTVAFDLGMRTLGSKLDLQIYGTPGQSRFDFMWDMLIRRAHAFILLVAANRSTDFQQAREILTFMNQRAQIPMMIGMTCTDLPGAWGQEHIMFALGYTSDRDRPPVVTVNPNDRTSVFEALMVLMAHMIAEGGLPQQSTSNSMAQRTTPTRSTYQWAAGQFARGR